MTITYKNSSSVPLSVEEVLEVLLLERGIEDVSLFYTPPHPEAIDFASFFPKSVYEKQWKSVISLLKKIKKNNGSIVVYCDYDADGITGGAILWQTLDALGFSVMPYIPDRKEEGYGFSDKGIDALLEKGPPSLIISVDHGIVGHSSIEYAKKHAIPIIVTDHHTKGETDPDAFAVFHTSSLSGSGVAYFFAREIARRLEGSSELLELFNKDYLALAAIGTIADLVPLHGPSRSIARHGLQAFQKVESVGLKELIRAVGLEGRPLRSYDIGYMLAPRINAFGRLGSGMDALRLLCTRSIVRAQELTRSAGTINTKRQKLVEQALIEAEKQVDLSKRILIVKDDLWEEGIVGLIAGKLVQKFGRPALAFTKGHDGVFKASARSLPTVHILEFLRGIDIPYSALGGHGGAAGLSIQEHLWDEFVDKTHRHSEHAIAYELLESQMDVDLHLPLPSYSMGLAEGLSKLEPFGMGNPEPLFSTTVRILDQISLGKTGKHSKFVVGSEDGGALEMVYFNKGSIKVDPEKQVTMIFRLGINEWNSRRKPQGIIEHIV